MKYQILNYLALSSILFFLGCNKEIISPVNTTSFTVEKATSFDESIPAEYISKVVKAKMTKKSSTWSNFSDGYIGLNRIIEFELTLANEEIIYASFHFWNTETDVSLLDLDENNSFSETGHSSRYWQYKDKTEELNKFYDIQSLKASISINNTYFYFNGDESEDSYTIEKANLFNLNGETKIYTEIQFQGLAYGYSNWSYDIKGGIFSGIMD